MILLSLFCAAPSVTTGALHSGPTDRRVGARGFHHVSFLSPQTPTEMYENAPCRISSYFPACDIMVCHCAGCWVKVSSCPAVIAPS